MGCDICSNPESFIMVDKYGYLFECCNGCAPRYADPSFIEDDPDENDPYDVPDQKLVDAATGLSDTYPF